MGWCPHTCKGLKWCTGGVIGGKPIVGATQWFKLTSLLQDNCLRWVQLAASASRASKCFLWDLYFCNSHSILHILETIASNNDTYTLYSSLFLPKLSHFLKYLSLKKKMKIYTWRWLAMLWRVRQSIPMISKILEGTALSTPSCSTACTNLLCNSGVQSTWFIKKLPVTAKTYKI